MSPSKLFTALALGSLALGSCSSDDPIVVDVPSTYSFERDGSSTVSYSGQTQRLDMLSELSSYAKSGTTEVLSADRMINMLHNTDSPFDKEELNQTGDSRKQIASKLYGQGDGSTPVDGGTTEKYFEGLLTDLATLSNSNGEAAENGKAGIVTSGTSSYLVDADGMELAQVLEKRLMGALLFHQGTNVYLGTEKLAVSNTELKEEKNYTSLEHHFDEAYGYFELPTDMAQFKGMGKNGELRFWGKYAYSRNGANSIGYDVAVKIHEEFRTARACMAAQYDNPDEEVDCSYDASISAIKKEWELILAASVIHYFNEVKEELSDQAKLSHALSEGWGFLESLAYANGGDSRLSDADIESIKTIIGTNFWEVSPQNIDQAISTIVSKYTELSDVKDQL